MVYYNMNNHRLVGFEASENKKKMYNAILLSNTGKLIKFHLEIEDLKIIKIKQK